MAELHCSVISAFKGVETSISQYILEVLWHKSSPDVKCHGSKFTESQDG